jgi:Conjugative transposon protein TcpC
MVRRSTVDRSPQPAVHSGVQSAGYEAAAGELTPGGRGTQRRRGGTPGWRGSGGRWLVWVFRAVAWAALLVIGFLGVKAIIHNETSPSQGSAATPAASTKFPVDLAAAYALQFGQVYLNASPATAGQRAGELARFLPGGADSQLGWSGSGILQLQSEQVAGIDVRNAHHAIVTLLVRVNGQLMELGVPVYFGHGGMSIAGEPAFLPAPARAVPPSPATAASDQATQQEMMSQLPAFFQAYASGNEVTLGRFLVPGTVMSGLDGQVSFGSLVAVNVPPGGSTRHITATVAWKVPGHPAPGSRTSVGSISPAGLEMSYALTIIKQHGTWYVADVSPSTQLAGSP